MASLTHEEAVVRAKNLVPSIKSRANYTEEFRRQPRETIEEFIDSGFIRMLMPKRWGGSELGFDTFYKTTVEIAKADPSAGWIFSLLVVHSWMLAYFPEAAQRDVWGENPDACITTSFSPFSENQVTPVEGGYLVNGDWGYSSGVDHSDWAMLYTGIETNEPVEMPKIVMMVVPRSDYTVLDTWKTTAQKGTGSNNLRLKDVFVPEHRTIDMISWCQKGDGPGNKLNDAPLYKHPLYAAMPVCLTSALFGASVGTYELWRDSIKSKLTARSVKVADFTHQQIRVAEVSATIAAAEALFEKTLERLRSEEPIDTYEKLRIRRNYGFIAKLCNQAVKTMMDHSGAGVIYETNPLQRYWRDVQASSMHITFNMDWLGEMFGKLELGLPLSQKDSLIS
ncbi:acyl-CoA dehydrogenase family protein [Ferviditalea candida]|uniref:Acyl-CoA dehydrogenase family protein n=1 Tax=Ferviditalea candida TaxID=3108399 RepID=A0ABU5ZC65_9BACL|nr:acyl-CoA dehydrogenase family protein [Paenibacillaceae bacterium T2]